jgi:PKD repeat protein
MKVLRIAALLSLLGLAGCAYDNPGAPASPAAPDLSTPSQLTLGASVSGTGGNSTLTARVQNSYGAPLANVIVTFATTRGVILPAQATTGSSGTATAVLAAIDTADVTVVAGGLTAHTLVAPIPTSSGSPTPSSPTTTAAFLNVSSSGTTGVPLVFSVSSAATGVTWNWSFGDGANTQTTTFATTHTYSRAGVYAASVSAAGTSAGNAIVTVIDPAPTPTPPAATLSVTLTCTPGTHGTPAPGTGTATSCNVNQTYGGATVPGGAVTGVAWDWGDGTTADNSSTSPVMTHQYINAGTYTVIATVTANTTGGSQTGTNSKSVIVP